MERDTIFRHGVRFSQLTKNVLLPKWPCESEKGCVTFLLPNCLEAAQLLQMLCDHRLCRKQVIGCPGGVMQAESQSPNLQVGASALVLKLAAGTHLGLVLMPREVLLQWPESHTATLCVAQLLNKGRRHPA